MFKYLTFLLFYLSFLCVKAQVPSQQTSTKSTGQSAILTTERYGEIDKADLEMKSCDFEKDANAEVLFDDAFVTYHYSTVVMERHKRIKIFNDHGKDEANIRIEFLGVHNDELIVDLQAQTINLTNGAIEYTNVDSKSIYTQNVDKETKAIIFTFPNVKSGSVIEYKYKKTTMYGYNYPDWFFQSSIPTRYSEFDASFIQDYRFTLFKKIYQPLFKDSTIVNTNKKSTRHIWAMTNIASYKQEPYMDFPDDYVQCVLSKIEHWNRTWITVGNWMLSDDDFGGQLNKPIANENEIIAKAAKLKTDEDKIKFLFDTVKRAMTWDKTNRWYCVDGIKKAWNKKTGNSAEINLILYRLLAQANVNTYLLALRTRGSGKLDFAYPTYNQLNKTVVYCQADSAKFYVLDASDKHNTYNNTPLDLIGLQALSLEAVSKKYQIQILGTGNTRIVCLINGSISANGKLEGTTQISCSTYSRKKAIEAYHELGEKNYINDLQKDKNGLKITALKLDNLDIDSIPLIQTFEFKYDLTEPDGDYMYFNPNVLTGFGSNPFLSENRIANIDFRCLYSYSINGRYKIPTGYKADALPKPVIMQMPDKSISFKRNIAEQEGYLLVHYSIDYKRALYNNEEYPVIRDFYKKMYEMINEQVVLKKL